MKFQLSTVLFGCASLVAAQLPTAIPSEFQSIIASAIENGGSSVDINSLISKASTFLGTDFASVTSQLPSVVSSLPPQLSSEVASATSQFSSQIASVSSSLSTQIASASSAMVTQSTAGSGTTAGSTPSKSSSSPATVNTTTSNPSNANVLSMSGLSIVIAFVCTLWN